MYGATGYQTLNIVETSVEPEISQVDEQDEYNVHYGTNSTSNNMGHKSKQKLLISHIRSNKLPLLIRLKFLPGISLILAIKLKILIHHACCAIPQIILLTDVFKLDN